MLGVWGLALALAGTALRLARRLGPALRLGTGQGGGQAVSSLDDPRVFWAAERTLLAWVRTGLAAMGLGLVTAKFGIFLRFVTHDAVPAAREGASLAVGVAITVLGAALCLAAALQFRRFVATLRANELPPRQLIGLPSLAALAFALTGLVMAGCLLL